jgi:outer membrane lipase/esterase
MGGGHFDQADEAMSLYAAYADGPIWGNMVASYGFIQDTVRRSVALGTFTDQNKADTNGQSVSLAVRGGYDFNPGWDITTGPVAGLVAQQVHLDGFTETGTSGVTALSFGSQTRDSFVSQLGWRGSVGLGDWRPFVEAEWNHEWADRNRTVTASLTSAAAAPYSADGVPVSSDWATATLGTSYKLTEQILLRGSLSAGFLNSQTTNFGGEVGLNVSF